MYLDGNKNIPNIRENLKYLCESRKINIKNAHSILTSTAIETTKGDEKGKRTVERKIN